jgi:DNA-binding LacI/PurR family transcriptional regulator
MDLERPADTIERPAVAILHHSAWQTLRRRAALAAAIQGGRHLDRLSDHIIADGCRLRRREFPSFCSIAAFSCDNIAGGQALADYSWSTGHLRPALVLGERDVTTNRERGFNRRLQELGMALYADEIGDGISYEAGYDAARRLIARRRRPDCIFFASDVMAIGGMDAIRATGMRVPGDVSVVGFDDIPMAASPSYELTTVRQPIARKHPRGPRSAVWEDYLRKIW